MMTARLTFRPDMPPIAWGKPNSPVRPLCAVCHSKLPEVPLMMWKSDGSCASFCDSCLERWITTVEIPPRSHE